MRNLPEWYILDQMPVEQNLGERTPTAIRKAVISFCLGLAGFLGAFYSFHFTQGNFSLSIVWSQAFPMVAAMAYGERYGFMAGIFGLGALFPFFLWSNNGWANVVTSSGYLFLYLWQGYFARKRMAKETLWNNPLIVQIPFLFFYAGLIYFLYPVAFSFNPPSWAPFSQTSMPLDMVRGIAFKSPVVMYLMTLFSSFLLVIPWVRSGFGLPIKAEARNNGLIFIASILSSLAVWFSLLAFNSIFIKEDYSYSGFVISSPFEISAFVAILGSGFLAGYVVSQFLEKRYAAEDVLRESEESLSITLQSIGDGVIATDIHGNVTRMNHTAQRLTGWTFSEAQNRPLSDVFKIINTRTRIAVENPIRDVFSRGMIVELANHTTLVSRNGKEYQIADCAAPIRDDRKVTKGAILVFSDVTEKYKAEEELRESEIKYRRLYESMNDCFVQLTMSGKIVDVNKSYLELLGYSKEEALNLTSQDLTPQHWHDFEDQIIRSQVLPRGFSDVYCKEYRKKDGTIFPVELKSFLLRDAQGLDVGIWAIVRDITERNRAEEERLKIQKLQSVGNLAGGIAHDFNNFLTGLYGNIAMAKLEMSQDHPGCRFLLKAEQSMSRAIALTKQLLTFAQGGNPVKEKMNIGPLVEETVRFDLSGSNVLPVFDQPDDLRMAEVDKGQIQQVLSNITINAKQAMPDGGRLYVTLENVQIPENAIPGLDQRSYIKLTLRDEGTGIEPKHLNRIFDPYFTTKKTGSGLGLATSHSIISKHKGTIHVESKPGQGATFTLYLPASEPSPPFPEQAPVPVCSALHHPIRILLMDDDEMIRDVGAKMLQRIGFLVETANDGREAIDTYEQAMKAGRPFSITIMDLTVPGKLGGKEAVRDILAMDPEARVVVSSGYADDPVMANFAAYGFKGVISKPYAIKEMHDVLSRLLDE